MELEGPDPQSRRSRLTQLPQLPDSHPVLLWKAPPSWPLLPLLAHSCGCIGVRPVTQTKNGWTRAPPPLPLAPARAPPGADVGRRPASPVTTWIPCLTTRTSLPFECLIAVPGKTRRSGRRGGALRCGSRRSGLGRKASGSGACDGENEPPFQRGLKS